MSLGVVSAALRQRWLLLLLGPLAAGAVAFALLLLVPSTYTAKTSFLPPQQQGANIAGTLATLGTIAGLGGVAPVRNSSDQYVALMQSALVADRLIDRFELMRSYDAKFRAEARRELAANARFSVGRKDGMVAIEVDDRDPARAAGLANAFVEELRVLLSRLVITEAQQRRVFFESQLQQAQERLVRAQLALQASGFSQGALRAEPKAAADEYGRLRAETTAAEVRVQMLRSNLAEGAPELRQAQSTLTALREQLARTERAGAPPAQKAGSDYVTKYRDFKYHETLFELFARQYEAARLDESREGTPIQVIDVASPPERPSAPRRARLSALAALVAFIALTATVLVRARQARHAAA
ncbi:MAG: lipopolysaccharide biosynthesis protein [Rubrivivax sp.]|nr:lipopolysaccharide biosynthesis protein [Rubrivivax sp.]